MKAENKKLKKDERGFAAIVIAISMILILSLITVGFAELMRHEQRSALDKHLSSQAYYAAESGINDAVSAINAGFNIKKSTCAPLTAGQAAATPGGAYLKANSVGGASDGVSYSCLLIDPAPTTLEYTISPGDNKTTEVSADSRINSLVISWQQEGGATNTTVPTAGHPLYATGGWPASTGMLRIGLTPIRNDTSVAGCAYNSLTRDCLVSNTFTAFLYPTSGGGAAKSYGTYPITMFAPSDATNGPIVDGGCVANSTPLFCNVQINGISDSNYLLSIKGLYQKSHVTVTAYNAATGATKLPIKNAQVLVDSTGKSQDVLRRVQVRVPLTNSYKAPDSALEVSTGICKQLQLAPTAGYPNTNNCTP